MFRLWLGLLLRCFCSRRRLLTENLALRQQLSVLKRRHPRPKLTAADRLFWLLARRLWSSWKEALILVNPATVVQCIATTLRKGEYPPDMKTRPVYQVHRFDPIWGFTSETRIVEARHWRQGYAIPACLDESGSPNVPAGELLRHVLKRTALEPFLARSSRFRCCTRSVLVTNS